MATGVRSFAKWLQLQAPVKLQEQYPQSLNGGRSERPSRGWGAKDACAACGLWREKGKRIAREARGRPYLRARLAGGAMNGPPYAHLRFVRATRTKVNVNLNLNIDPPRKLTRSDPRPPTPSVHVEGHLHLTSLERAMHHECECVKELSSTPSPWVRHSLRGTEKLEDCSSPRDGGFQTVVDRRHVTSLSPLRPCPNSQTALTPGVCFGTCSISFDRWYW